MSTCVKECTAEVHAPECMTVCCDGHSLCERHQAMKQRVMERAEGGRRSHHENDYALRSTTHFRKIAARRRIKTRLQKKARRANR